MMEFNQKGNIIKAIHTLVSNNVIGSKQLMSRYKGFRGELFFDNLLSVKYPSFKRYDGGIIMSKDSKVSSLINSVYITTTSGYSSIDDYVNIYTGLSHLGFQQMFLVCYEEEFSLEQVMFYENETVSLPVPKMKIYVFDIEHFQFVKTNNKVEHFTDFFTDKYKRNRNSFPIGPDCQKWLLDELNQFSKEQLIKVYMDRLFLDGFIGFSKNKGKVSDIDLILKRPNGHYRFVEIKEKDLPKRAKKGFGLDIPRLGDMKKIESETGIPYFLSVRHINNQIERLLLNWRYISIDDFERNVRGGKAIEGGTGMRSSNSNNPTLICDLDQFGYL